MRKGFYSSAAPRPQAATSDVAEKPRRSWRAVYKRYEKAVLVVAGAAFATALVAVHAVLSPAPPVLTQEDIDQAVAHSLETKPVPSPAVKAYQAVRASIVRVRASDPDQGDASDAADKHARTATGSGVVIVDRGVILTALHVVEGAGRVRVQFEDGTESDADVVSRQPANDTAVLQARRVPDDLKAATLRSAKHLVEGEHVTAVGFPFGIGPSVSHGVISGLERSYGSPDGERTLSNLIQFDAAANPGSSGGPLVNAAGEVIGIVVAILTVSEKGAFSGIGFAVPIETAAGAAGLPPF